MTKYLPKKFFVQTQNLNIWNIVESRFKELGYKREFDFPPQQDKFKDWGICCGFAGSKRLSHSPRWYYLGYPEVSLIDLLTLDFAPEVEKFELAHDLVVEIHKDKVVWEGNEFTFELVRDIAAMEKSKFILKCPNKKIYDIVAKEVGRTRDSWKIYKDKTCLDSDGDCCNEEYYKDCFLSYKFITLEELFSRRVDKMYVCGHKVEVRKYTYTIGCKTIKREKMLELAAKCEQLAAN